MRKLTVKPDECTGCMRCEQACAAEHSKSKRMALSAMERPLPRTRIFIEYHNGPVPVVCRHCEEPLCVSACMAGCMQKDPVTGMVDNMGHEQQCVGCWMCVMACPYGVITPALDAQGAGGSDFALARKCDLCPERGTPACVEACPMKVLGVETRDEETADCSN